MGCGGRWAGAVFFSQPVSMVPDSPGQSTAGESWTARGGGRGCGQGLISPWATLPGPSSRPTWAPRVTEATGRRGLCLASPGKRDEWHSRQRAEEGKGKPRAEVSSSYLPPTSTPLPLPFRRVSLKTWQGGLPRRPSHLRTRSFPPLSPDCPAQITR